MADQDEQEAAQEHDKLIPSGVAGVTRAIHTEEQRRSVLLDVMGQWVPSSDHALGAFLLVVVALIWTAASFLVQYIQQDLGFAKPLFITYVSNALFSVLLVFEFIRARLGTTPHYSYLGRPGDISWKKEANSAAKVAVVWFAAQATYNWSLNGTTVSVSTILSSTSCVFTFAMSLVFLHEKFSLLSMLGVILTVGGAAVTTLSANTPSQGDNTGLGVSLCLGSALLYGMYTILIRQVTPSDEGVFNLRVMFGFIGFFNLVLLAPVIGILHATGTEDLSGLTWNIFGLIVIKGLFDNVLSDVLWAMAILLTSPTAATIGLSLTVPLAIVSDWLLQSIVPSGLMILGALLVVVGFILASAVEPEQARPDGRTSAEPVPEGRVADADAAELALRDLGTVETGAALPSASELRLQMRQREHASGLPATDDAERDAVLNPSPSPISEAEDD